MNPERIVSRSKARILGWNPWNQNTEPGDIMVDESAGKAYRLETGSGFFKRTRGELYPREIKKPGYRAVIENGKLIWVRGGV